MGEYKADKNWHSFTLDAGKIKDLTERKFKKIVISVNSDQIEFKKIRIKFSDAGDDLSLSASFILGQGKDSSKSIDTVDRKGNARKLHEFKFYARTAAETKDSFLKVYGVR